MHETLNETLVDWLTRPMPGADDEGAAFTFVDRQGRAEAVSRRALFDGAACWAGTFARQGLPAGG
ncbi:hypothetical protein JZU57_00875, partial [bacterium]|nr:hypothetical protein [bacterium]